MKRQLPQRPLRILHIGKYYPPYRGGMESFLADLVEQQRASGLDAHAIVHGKPLANDPPWLVRVPVQVKLVFAPIALGFPVALWRTIRRVKPDIIHMHMPNNAVFWALLLPSARRVPWVVHWHSDVLINRWDRLLATCYQLYRPFQHKILREADAILATSPPYMAASKPLQHWLFKTIAIPLGLKHLADDQLPREADHSAETDALWGDARLRVLSVGRLIYYKGFDTLINAVAGETEVTLLIAGEGEERPRLEALIRQHKLQSSANVRLLGNVSEEAKDALFRSCDIFALASRERTEAFGLVLIEAMQRGKPCMVSDLEGSGMSWIVDQAGAGHSYAPNQVDAWRGAIRQCLATKAELEIRGEHARAVAEEQFSIAQCERRINNVYENVLRNQQDATEESTPATHGRRLRLQFSDLNQLSAPTARQLCDHPPELLIHTGQEAPQPQLLPRHIRILPLQHFGMDEVEAIAVAQAFAHEVGAEVTLVQQSP